MRNEAAMGALHRRLALVASIVLTSALPLAARADTFTVTSAAFADDGLMPSRFANTRLAPDGRPCGGQNVSPPIAWSGAPAATKSYAVTLIDPDGHKGLGVVHWVAYNFPAGQMSVPEGRPTAGGTPGKTSEASGYSGVCPPLGAAPHHYLIQVYALDAALDLAPGLDRDALLKAIEPHVIGVTSYAGRYGR
jgi:Raf kinase inhibitor-like YbhB/YbcL family protein